MGAGEVSERNTEVGEVIQLMQCFEIQERGKKEQMCLMDRENRGLQMMKGECRAWIVTLEGELMYCEGTDPMPSYKFFCSKNHYC